MMLVYVTAQAEPRAVWKWSAAALVAGASADVASSYGRVELNPLLRGPDGRFGARGVVLRSGIVTGAILTSWAVLRRCPRSKAPVVMNFAVGAGLGGVSVRNWRTR